MIAGSDLHGTNFDEYREISLGGFQPHRDKFAIR